MRISRRSTNAPWAALCCAFLLSAGAAPVYSAPAKGKLWVELGAKKRRAVNIPSVAPLVKRYGAAMLVVNTVGDGPGELPPGHPAMPPMPDGFQGQGSGFVIHPSGYALTNNHVIENARTITVRVGTGRKSYDAEVVGTDIKTDVALIRIKSARRDWPVIPLGDSDAADVGDFVVAIGNPFGLAHTVSLGILSAKSRRDINPGQRAGLYDFLQTDASINPGNSGGPLLNLAGEVVGINTAVNSAAQGIGFAIPVNMVKAMIPALQKDGRVTRAWIGISIQPVAPELAAALGLKEAQGALVRQVVDGGPGQKAGLMPGDVIVAFNGERIANANALPLVAGDAGVGTQAQLDVVREGKRITLPCELEAHPDNQPARGAASQPVLSNGADSDEAESHDAQKRTIGLKIVSLNDEDRARLGLAANEAGVVVVGVRPGSAAFKSGLRPDDVIVQLNSKRVVNAQAFAESTAQVTGGGVLAMSVLRGRSRLFLAVIKP